MRIKLLIISILAGCNTIACAQSYKNEFGFKSDNDAYLFYGQDRYYTNGLFISFKHATDQQKLGNKLSKLTYAITAGQKMYNPISGYAPKPEDQDRPFAGYLYVGGDVSLFYKNERVLKTGLELGTIGPNALGKEAQELLHKIVGFYEIKGWEYQISNELAANLSAQYMKLLHRAANNQTDFSLVADANIGTTFSNGDVGILFRAGKVNQLFNSITTHSRISNNSETKELVNHEFFFYAKPQLAIIAYDATIQGGMFTNDSPVTFKPKRLVFSQQIGFDYSTPRFTFDFGMIFKSREIKSTALAHQYGTISMYYRFN